MVGDLAAVLYMLCVPEPAQSEAFLLILELDGVAVQGICCLVLLMKIEVLEYELS